LCLILYHLPELAQCFCFSHVDSRVPLSFPTRRSSDLRPAPPTAPAGPGLDRAGLGRFGSSGSLLPTAAGIPPKWPHRLPGRPPPDRKSTRLNSKSRENLVCRLLLEKKNTHKTIQRHIT